MEAKGVLCEYARQRLGRCVPSAPYHGMTIERRLIECPCFVYVAAQQQGNIAGRRLRAANDVIVIDQKNVRRNPIVRRREVQNPKYDPFIIGSPS
jgi:hypothetical protein